MNGLSEPAKYTPWTKGVYDVSPSLKPLGTDYGNGAADARWFQFDSRREEFLASKHRAIAENPDKYVFRAGLTGDVERAAFKEMAFRLSVEYPQDFGFEFGSDGLKVATETDPVTVLGGLDELAMVVQEDICVVSTSEGKDWLSYLHICSPSHWRASEKIGKPFFDVHEVIPGFDKVNRVAGSLVEAMVQKGPFVRFVWGVESDDRPNHHPDAPYGHDPRDWDGRDFSKGRFWVRSERQVIWGLPEVGAALFTITVSHMPGSEVLDSPYLRDSLVASLESMSPESRKYKGLARDWGNLMRLLAPEA